jgi:fibronectin-binding autotransporter adhesin
MKNLNSWLLLFLLLTVFTKSNAQTTTVSFTNPANNGLPANTFTVPAGVTNVSINVYGAGGGGGRKPTSSDGGGGGGGGGFRGGSLAVTPGNTITVAVGTGGTVGVVDGVGGNAGGNSSVTHTLGTITANGGSGGGSGITGAGAGGAGGGGSFTGTVTSQIAFTGGAGGNGDNSEGGGGGGGAGLSGAGGAGDPGSAGTHNGGTAGGGNAGTGGAGGNDEAGINGNTAGGGGGAAGDDGGFAAGTGANGRVDITYTLPNTTGISLSATSICNGNGTDVTISSSNLVTGTYTITYNVTGTLNSISSTDVNISFTAGAPGTATFTTAALANAENSTVNITRITNSSGNYVDLTSTANFTVYACRSWYSYQTGNFNDFNTWTLDPSGSTFDNGTSLTPTTFDEVTILNGFTVTYNINNVVLTTTKIEGGGILDMAATTGHTLGVITGTGLLRINGTSLPTGTYTDFVSTLGGTIEYYNTGGNLPTTQTTYNNLMMTNSAGSIIYVLVSNMTVNGTFSLTTTGGTVTWQINDASDTQRTITLNSDLNVASGGRITVGTGNEGTAATPQHALTMYGNITNSGIIKFYDPTDPELAEADYGLTYPTVGVDLHRNELQGNAVNVTFAGTVDKTVMCNNTTDFYRLILNKGTGQQAILTINSANNSYFRLFGPANIATSETTPSTNSWEWFSANALSLINGTLELKGNINIPVLQLNLASTTGYFPIPRNAGLWLNDAGVNVQISDLTPDVFTGNKDGRILISGLLRVSNGFLFDGFSKGLGSQDGGTYLQEGGLVRCWQFRPRSVAGNPSFSFKQTGGTMDVGYNYALSGGKIDQFENDYGRFDLATTNSTFEMSGNAILNIAKPTRYDDSPVEGGDGTLDGGLFRVASSSANYNVTGGTVNFYMGAEIAGGSYPGYIITTAPLYSVNIYEESATTETAQLQTNSLIVLNSLTINTTNSPSFVTNNLNVTVGGNFIINTGATYTPGTGTTTFNGTSAQVWTHDGTISALASVVMNKASGTLTLAGSQAFPSITTVLTLTAGILADGGKTVTVTGTLSNSATHSGSGVIIYNNAGASTIGGNNGTFGNLTIQTNATIATSGAQTVSGTLRLVGANTTLNISSNALNALSNIYSDASPGTAIAFTASKRILTSGLHNAGGLTRQGGSGNILFPVGTGSLYTPATINVTASTHGTITMRPVASEHPNVTSTAQSVRYYWSVVSSGYVGITAVTHSSYDYSTTTEDNPTANYRSARYDPDAFTWATNNTVFNANTSPPIPDFSTGTDWAGVVGDRLDGEYTCGNVIAFGNVTVYFSKASGNWNATTTWSNDPVLRHSGADAAVAPPCANCPVVIGDGTTFNHTVATVANSFCGSLALSTESTLDCSTFTGHNFGTNTGGVVTGRGKLRINSNVFPPGDFTNFIGPNGGTVEWYGDSKTIPFTGGAPQFLDLPNYYNLVINPDPTRTITLPANPLNVLTVYNDLTIGDAAGYTGTVVTNGARTIAVTGNVTITRGIFNFSNAAASATTMTIGGNLTTENGTSFSVLASGTTNANTLSIAGNITNNGTLNFNGTGGTVALTFTGNSNASFGGTGSGGTTLFTLTVNKGTSQTPTLTLNVGGTVTTTARALGWVTISNGTFNWTTANATTLSTSTYTISPTAKLKVSAGTVTHSSGDADANDLFLNGAIEVSGGILNVGNTTVNGNNVDIEYGSAGVPSITVSSGSLWVKSSIRRSTSTITGALIYSQTGNSTVTVGGISSTENNTRGVFEIDANTGSSFTLTGTSSLIVERQTGGTSYADLFINPLTSNVSSTSTVTVGVTTNNAQANFRINFSPTIGNFTIRNGDGNDAQTVNMFSNNLVLGGTLTIPSPSILNTNSLDVTIAGNLVCPGTYTGGTNNTTFNGADAQSAELSGSSAFNDFTVSKTGSTTLTLSGTSPTLQNLYILAGILDVGPLDLSVAKNVTNNSSQIGLGSILINSTTPISNTITSGGGSFTNLTFAGAATSKVIDVVGNTTINGALAFPGSGTRYFNVGSYLLTLGESSSITNATSTRFIRTNGVASDLGITKTWAVGTSTFEYPIGTSSNYTPASYTLNVTTSGTLNVIPVNSFHPTYNQDSPEQILDYYWIVSRVGSSLVAIASGNHTYSYPSGLINGSGGALVAGYLDGNSDPLGWTTGGHGGSATSSVTTFASTPTTNFPAANNSYDYSVGTINTLPNPIIPLYSRVGGNATTVGDLNVGGDWTLASNWTTDTDGDPDNNNPSAFAPTGVPVVILSGTRINTSIGNGRRAYRTTIQGLLNNDSRTGHNLGIVSGTGTFRTATNTFPAGNYAAFVALGGGTIEYVAPMTMNNRTTYNNLSVYSGSSGTVTMSASNLTLNGNLIIPSGVTINNANNANIDIVGNWSNSGTFTPGTGTVTFTGNNAQTVSGANAFNDLTINKASQTVTLSGTGSTTVADVLTLTSGNIAPSATNILVLGANASVSGGSASSFVTGPMTKVMNASTTFNAPVGGSSRYRPATIANTSGADTWSFEYVASNPTSGGYSKDLKNTTNIQSVSRYEYWLVSRLGATQADLTLSYGTGSYTPPDIGVIANLRVARWDGAQWDLPPVGGGSTNAQSSGNNISGTVMVTNMTSFSPVTLSSLDGDSPLPIELISFTGKVIEDAVELEWKTLTEIDNNYFSIEKSADGEKFSEIGKVKGAGTTYAPRKYLYLDGNLLPGKVYYRLRQVDFNRQFSYSDVITIEYNGDAQFDIKLYPNPAHKKSVTLELHGLIDVSSVPISIYDLVGHEYLKATIEVDTLNGVAATQINIDNMPNGVYMLRVGTTDNYIQRLIIAK